MAGNSPEEEVCTMAWDGCARDECVYRKSQRKNNTVGRKGLNKNKGMLAASQLKKLQTEREAGGRWRCLGKQSPNVLCESTPDLQSGVPIQSLCFCPHYVLGDFG